MFELIRTCQQDLMLSLSAVCVMIALLLLLTRYLSRRRKWILFLLELIAALLPAFDRFAYAFRGSETAAGYFMAELSNFMVFFLTSAIVFSFNLYLTDLLHTEGGLPEPPRRLKAVTVIAAAGMAMVAVAHFTGLYYYFDEQHLYRRGPAYLLSYLVPVLCPLIQLSVIWQHRKKIRRLIFVSLVTYILVPIAAGIVQIFTYGLSLVTMATVLVSVSLYVFTYLDINDEALKIHAAEVGGLQKERQSMKRLFDQTVTAFVNAVEKRDPDSAGHSARTADLARRIAAAAGKSPEACEEVYYAALLHDVGAAALSDNALRGAEDCAEELRRKPLLSAEILSCITEYPYLREGARSCCEQYDGKGYPEGLRGRAIPEIARIIAVADAYTAMTDGSSGQAPQSYQVVREEFIKQAGTRFDPELAEIMVQIMDADRARQETDTALETALVCGKYRETVSAGIPAEQEVTQITFTCTPEEGADFSAPSVIVFDSYDRHVHRDAKTIQAYRYLEYCEIWFDGHCTATNLRNRAVTVTDNQPPAPGYSVTAGRFEDHLSIRMVSPAQTAEIILALPDNSKSAYIGLTGEHCRLSQISAEKTGALLHDGSIPQIVSKIRYTDRLESDLPNLQIDHEHSAATAGIPVRGEVILDFHTMSLPSANLVWHCPHILLFSSDDQTVGGAGFREIALIKINGESSGSSDIAVNTLHMKKAADFPGWDAWKAQNKAGMECSVRIVRRGRQITVSTENLGISIDHITQLADDTETVCAALTGDMIALTDIRVR